MFKPIGECVYIYQKATWSENNEYHQMSSEDVINVPFPFFLLATCLFQL